MECKCVSVPPGCTSHQELIDTLWNVNAVYECFYFRGFSELIDTLWNVNFGYFETFDKGYFELIDTLWNVNQMESRQ